MERNVKYWLRCSVGRFRNGLVVMTGILISGLLIFGTNGCSNGNQKTTIDTESCAASFREDLKELTSLKRQGQLTESEYTEKSMQLLRKHIDALLELAIEDCSVPAIAAGITTSEIDVYVEARGVRKLGKPARVEIDDLFHTGSNTKAMTATMIGILVDRGLLRWDSNPEEVLGVASEKRKDDGLTLAHLLTHSGGIPIIRGLTFKNVPRVKGDIRTQRRHFARWLLPKRKAIGTYEYANAGYSIAAAMAEAVSGKTWENLLEEYLFEPLDIDAVIGWPSDTDPNQPWGHTDQWILAQWFSPRGAVRPQKPSYKLCVLNRPAGDVSMSMGDYMKFLREHLRGLKGQSSLIRQDIFTFLHTPMVPNSACGWGVYTESLTGLEVHGHSGSGGTFYIRAGLFPERDFAVAVATNAGSGDAARICGDVRKALTALYWAWLNRGAGSSVVEPNTVISVRVE